MLVALSAGAYIYFARASHDALEPLLTLPEGRDAYAASLRRAAVTIALFDAPLGLIVGIAAYVLARVSVRPILLAREREERFAADAAHELRTPLATIAAVAQAARPADAATQSRALETIVATALEASGLLADLLLLMRDSTDETQLHEPIDLARLVRVLVTDAQTGPNAIPIHVTLPADGAYVIGDERALGQLVQNLLANAVRFARTHVAAEVRTDGNAIVLTIEDDGAGVAPGDRERIFERFYKADPSAPGSGLGLAICRHIARRHHGTLALDGSSRFVARFPRAT